MPSSISVVAGREDVQGTDQPSGCGGRFPCEVVAGRVRSLISRPDVHHCSPEQPALFGHQWLAPVRRPLRVSVGSVRPAMDALRTLPRRTLAAATAVLIFVALAFAYFLDVTDNEEGEGDVVGWLIVSAVASLIAAALLMRFVPATESDPDGDNRPARRGLMLSVLSVVTLAVFWTGLPFVLRCRRWRWRPRAALAPARGSWRAGDRCGRPRGAGDRARTRRLRHRLIRWAVASAPRAKEQRVSDHRDLPARPHRS